MMNNMHGVQINRTEILRSKSKLDETVCNDATQYIMIFELSVELTCL